MKVVILGAPGSGKDTEAKKISRKFNLKHIITSSYFIKEYKSRTRLGLEVYNKYLSKGKLCPDNTTIKLIKKHLPKNNYLLNGFPRTLKQAIFLDKFAKPDVVIYLNVDKRILKSRLLKRANIERRMDDTPEIIEKRLNIYEKDTKPLIKYYKNLAKINGNRTPKKIFNDILR